MANALHFNVVSEAPYAHFVGRIDATAFHAIEENAAFEAFDADGIEEMLFHDLSRLGWPQREIERFLRAGAAARQTMRHCRYVTSLAA